MYIFRIDEPLGDIQSNEEGDFYWISFKDILKDLTNTLPELPKIVEMLRDFNGQITFSEINYYPKHF